MRKFTTAFLILALALGISACGNVPKSETPISENNVSESRTEQTETSGIAPDVHFLAGVEFAY